MRIEFIEISNFRKLISTRVGISKETTVFVGANNSGKTSAITALRYFLVQRERTNFTLNDFTLSHWPAINAMGLAWEQAFVAQSVMPEADWGAVLPSVDVWLDVAENELHYVQPLIPTLDWEVGRLGVRVRYEPNDVMRLQVDYVSARNEVLALQREAEVLAAGQSDSTFQVKLWPESLVDFLQRRLTSYFTYRYYVLDPAAISEPVHGVAQPQSLNCSEPIEGDPFKGLIRIDEISAQRGFGSCDDGFDGDKSAIGFGSRKLSAQLRQYYVRHLDPYEKPNAEDLHALRAIEEAQQAFDGRLIDGFEGPLKEMHRLGYPGVTDPKLHISTRLRPVEGLNHEAAVCFEIPVHDGEKHVNLHLPEDSNGLGYQNLISMVFRLMAFRDSWMQVGKAKAKMGDDAVIPPLHLVLIEEPEVHLHTQVQQVFIRQAYKILRNHSELENNEFFQTQMVVSTHSSHIAHACEFDSLRYFRRLPGSATNIPTSCVVNLDDAFGDAPEAKRFATRYLRVTHCDLLFADAAIFIEGPAERILIPHFISERSEFAKLSESYITWLEIGGSHAHRLRSLVERIGLTTLIITDLDSCDTEGKAAVPLRGQNYTTRNQTLRSWCPAVTQLDELLDKPDAEKIKFYTDERFAVRVAYQCPVQINFKDITSEALAYTLEDSIVYENLALFSGLDGTGLIAKFRKSIAESANCAALATSLREDLTGGNKAEFALDLLEIEDSAALTPPTYIRLGLLWLAEQLEHEQVELGGVRTVENPPLANAGGIDGGTA